MLDTTRRRRSTARCSAPARRSTSALPEQQPAGRRCARSATTQLARARRAATSTPGSAATSTRWSRDARRGRDVRDAAAGAAGSARASSSGRSCARYPMSGDRWSWRRSDAPPTASRRSGPTLGPRRGRPTWPFALNVLTFRGDRISDVVAFAVREIDAPARRTITAGPRAGTDAARLETRSNVSGCLTAFNQSPAHSRP